MPCKTVDRLPMYILLLSASQVWIPPLAMVPDHQPNLKAIQQVMKLSVFVTVCGQMFQKNVKGDFIDFDQLPSNPILMDGRETLQIKWSLNLSGPHVSIQMFSSRRVHS